MPQWLRFDEREDAINALEHAAETALTLEENPLNWKWVIISLHNALQGALVCTLSGTTGVGALTDRSMKKMLEWFEVSRNNANAQVPKARLADLMTLYGRAKLPDLMKEFGGGPLQTTKGQDDDVRLLNSLRRNFAHFRPGGWSIETAGLPRVVLNVTAIIELLLLDHPSNTLRLKRVQIARVKKTAGMLRKRFSST